MDSIFWYIRIFVFDYNFITIIKFSIIYLTNQFNFLLKLNYFLKEFCKVYILYLNFFLVYWLKSMFRGISFLLLKMRKWQENRKYFCESIYIKLRRINCKRKNLKKWTFYIKNKKNVSIFNGNRVNKYMKA